MTKKRSLIDELVTNVCMENYKCVVFSHKTVIVAE